MLLLKLGATGDEVKQVQSRLGITADGIFGPQTEREVKAWQAANGLVADGIVGDQTWAKMFGQTTASNTAAGPVPDGTLNLAALQGVIPDAVLAQLPDTAKQFGISNVLRMAHFLAQCAHESGRFTTKEENLNYSAGRLQEVFPRQFPNADVANTYAGQPKKIGARAYANMNGNSDEASGDGYSFRGRGYLQTTGKANYQEFGKFIAVDLVSTPDQVATQYPLMSAAFFFKKRNLWTTCDKGADDATVKAVTKVVNGGFNGLTERIALFNQYHALLTK